MINKMADEGEIFLFALVVVIYIYMFVSFLFFVLFIWCVLSVVENKLHCRNCVVQKHIIYLRV